MIRQRRSLILPLCMLITTTRFFCQTVIPVTFRYTPDSEATRVFIPGSFNGWGPNSSGVIAPDAPSRMDWSETLQCYTKIISLNNNTLYQYKFHTHPNNAWITDPLNPNINTDDNNNSMITVTNGMIFQMQPMEGSVWTDPEDGILACICIADNDSVLLNNSYIEIDGETVSSFEGFFLDSLSMLQAPLPVLSDGSHQLGITVRTAEDLSFSAASTFTARMGYLFFITPDHDVIASPKTIRWRVNLDIANLDSVILRQIGAMDSAFVPSAEKDYSASVHLDYGINRFLIRARESNGTWHVTDTLTLNFSEPQTPQPEIQLSLQDSRISIAAVGHDPQNQEVTFKWRNAYTNGSPLPNLDNQTGSSLEIDVPDEPGDYAIHLTATDSDQNNGTTQTFFTVLDDGSVRLPELETVAQWVRDASIYSMFIKGFTDAGTIDAAAGRLEYIRDLGFNVIWVLPVMDVDGELDQNYNIGYNIVDFYNVEPGYGSNEDFRDFVSAAHDLGLRVILDVTPNHSGQNHPFALDARSRGPFSRYWDFYQHEQIPHNANNMSQVLSPDGIIFYSNFSSALLNWNWADAEARLSMIRVYTHWLQEYDIDGFRMDVYWGPHRRYGSDRFDRPLRQALRAVKADILILGETDGTGTGTEYQYADRSGGADMAYDWNLMWDIYNYPSISVLNEKLLNWSYRPGENSSFLRFLENHDEVRVANRYNSIEKTRPVSCAIFMATGTPMLYQGQEVGMGFGMTGTKEYLARSTVQWDNPSGDILLPHYQKLAQIRAQYPQFRRPFTDTNGDGQINASDQSVQPRLSTSSSQVYAYGRPWPDENGLVVANFSGQPQEVAVDLDTDSWMEFISIPYVDADHLFANDLYSNTSKPVPADVETLHVSLSPYGTAVYILSLEEKNLILPDLSVRVHPGALSEQPALFRLYPNYPNPFNPSTTIKYNLPEASPVHLTIYNSLGRPVKQFRTEILQSGAHSIQWNGLNDSGEPLPSGIYILQMQWKNRFSRQKMILIR